MTKHKNELFNGFLKKIKDQKLTRKQIMELFGIRSLRTYYSYRSGQNNETRQLIVILKIYFDKLKTDGWLGLKSYLQKLKIIK